MFITKLILTVLIFLSKLILIDPDSLELDQTACTYESSSEFVCSFKSPIDMPGKVYMCICIYMCVCVCYVYMQLRNVFGASRHYHYNHRDSHHSLLLDTTPDSPNYHHHHRYRHQHHDGHHHRHLPPLFSTLTTTVIATATNIMMTTTTIATLLLYSGLVDVDILLDEGIPALPSHIQSDGFLSTVTQQARC